MKSFRHSLMIGVVTIFVAGCNGYHKGPGRKQRRSARPIIPSFR